MMKWSVFFRFVILGYMLGLFMMKQENWIDMANGTVHSRVCFFPFHLTIEHPNRIFERLVSNPIPKHSRWELENCEGYFPNPFHERLQQDHLDAIDLYIAEILIEKSFLQRSFSENEISLVRKEFWLAAEKSEAMCRDYALAVYTLSMTLPPKNNCDCVSHQIHEALNHFDWSRAGIDAMWERIL